MNNEFEKYLDAFPKIYSKSKRRNLLVGSEPSQTSEMELFTEIVTGIQPLTISAKD